MTLHALVYALLTARRRTRHALHLKLRDAARLLPDRHRDELVGLVQNAPYRAVEDLRRDGIRTGAFAPHDPRLIARALLGLLSGLNADGGDDAETLSASVVTFVLHGLAGNAANAGDSPAGEGEGRER